MRRIFGEYGKHFMSCFSIVSRSSAVGFALFGVIGCSEEISQPRRLEGVVKLKSTKSDGSFSTHRLQATVASSASLEGYVTVVVAIPGAGAVNFIVAEPIGRAVNSSGGAPDGLSPTSAAAGDAAQPWTTLDTGDGSLRVKRAVGGVPVEIVNIKVSTGDTAFVASRNAWSDGTRIRSDFYSIRNKQGERLDIDLRDVYTSAIDVTGEREIGTQVVMLRTILAVCGRVAFTLLSPTPLSAQSSCDPAALELAVERARELRNLGVAGFGLTVAAGVIGTVVSGGWGSLIAATSAVAGGFGLLAAQAQYNWAQDDLYRCTHNGAAPPRCGGPTIGSCKRVK
jgi:hypothetical protein